MHRRHPGGDEDFLLYAVNARSGAQRKLTDFKQTRVRIYALSWERPDEAVIGLNNRDPKWHDAWLLNFKTGALEKLHENVERLDGYMFDEQLVLRFATRATADGGSEVLKVTPDGTLSLFLEIGFEDSFTTGPSGLTADGRTLYFRDSRGRDRSVLKAIDVVTGEAPIIAESDQVDIGGTLNEPVSGRVLAYSTNYLRTEWHAIDPGLQGDLDFLRDHFEGEWSIASQTKDGRTWVVYHDPVTDPASYVLYQRDAKSISELFTIRPALEGKPLVSMHPLELKSRDGLTLISYLSLPPGSDRDGNGRPDQPVSMVLNVHGGPWGRDGFGFDATHQWLANRGYAVLSVNFRGSTGFGKGFVAASEKEWAGRMHDDLIDAVNWAIAEKIAPRDKIAIYGGSYGGYATLMGLTYTPDVFACGVDVVGPSNLETLLASTPAYWESFKVQLNRRVGDPRTEEGRELLAERSPQ